MPEDCTEEWEEWIKKTQGEINSQTTTDNQIHLIEMEIPKLEREIEKDHSLQG